VRRNNINWAIDEAWGVRKSIKCTYYRTEVEKSIVHFWSVEGTLAHREGQMSVWS